MATVDVLMPVREPAPWLEQSLAALSAQRDVDWRLVLVVHGSDTDTSLMARRLGLPVTVCRAEASLPFPEVLDLGLQECTAPFVARMDADDVALPGRLSRTGRLLEERPELSMVASWVELIDSAGGVTGMAHRARSEGALVRSMKWHNVVVHSSVTFRRTAILDAGGYGGAVEQVEDYDLWLRVLARGGIGLVPEVLVQHRVHPGQVSRRKAVGAAAASAVGGSRAALARSRGESVLAARSRHAIWSGVQALRRWHRG